MGGTNSKRSVAPSTRESGRVYKGRRKRRNCEKIEQVEKLEKNVLAGNLLIDHPRTSNHTGTSAISRTKNKDRGNSQAKISATKRQGPIRKKLAHRSSRRHDSTTDQNWVATKSEPSIKPRRPQVSKKPEIAELLREGRKRPKFWPRRENHQELRCLTPKSRVSIQKVKRSAGWDGATSR